MRPRSDPVKMKNSTQTTLPHFNFSVTAELKDVTSRLIILINEEINEANWMVSNSAKLDRRTKQHTQFGVSASNVSRDMARTKSWRKKEEKKNTLKNTNDNHLMLQKYQGSYPKYLILHKCLKLQKKGKHNGLVKIKAKG